MINKHEIFFSYSWNDRNEYGQDHKNIVTALFNSLKKDGYKVIRDKEDGIYRGSIREFMRRIGKGHCIVVAISDKYLESPSCMFELLEIYRQSNSEIETMRSKIFPIVLSDSKIIDPVDRLNFVAFWKLKKKDLEQKILEVGLENAIGAIEDFRIYQDITTNIATLTHLLQDMNALNPQVLSLNNFAIIKKAITESSCVPFPVPPAQNRWRRAIPVTIFLILSFTTLSLFYYRVPLSTQAGVASDNKQDDLVIKKDSTPVSSSSQTKPESTIVIPENVNANRTRKQPDEKPPLTSDLSPPPVTNSELPVAVCESKELRNVIVSFRDDNNKLYRDTLKEGSLNFNVPYYLLDKNKFITVKFEWNGIPVSRPVNLKNFEVPPRDEFYKQRL